MVNPETNQDSSEKPVLTLIQQIKDGLIKPGTLTKDQRHGCVEVLMMEGCFVSQIAQIMDRSEKTIRRDLIEIRTRNALTPGPELAKQLIGHFFMKWEAQQSSLIRLARSKDGSVAERAQAERHAWDILKGGMELLQSLGYLPQQPKQIVGDVFHHLQDDAGSSLEATRQTILEIETVAKDTGTLTPELTTQIKSLQQLLDQAQLHQDAQQLLEKQQAANSKEDSDGS